MSDKPAIRVLLLDIGGVLLTNGWDRPARHRAAEMFGLDEDDMNERHHLTFDTYEDDREMFVEVAAGMGIHSIHHTGTNRRERRWGGWGWAWRIEHLNSPPQRYGPGTGH
jgi:hypothetical protein